MDPALAPSAAPITPPTGPPKDPIAPPREPPLANPPPKFVKTQSSTAFVLGFVFELESSSRI